MKLVRIKFAYIHFAPVISFALVGCSAGSLDLGESHLTAEPPPANYSAPESSSQIRLANRMYVGAELLQIFGDSAQADITNFVTNQVATVGGPCEIYSSATDIYSGCGNNASNTRAPILASATSTYAAFALVRVCDAILGKNNGSLAYASSRVIQRMGTFSTLSPNSEEIQRIWEQFNPGESLPNEVMTEFNNIVLEVKQKRYAFSEEWRFLYLVNCYNAGRYVP